MVKNKPKYLENNIIGDKNDEEYKACMVGDAGFVYEGLDDLQLDGELAVPEEKIAEQKKIRTKDKK